MAMVGEYLIRGEDGACPLCPPPALVPADRETEVVTGSGDICFRAGGLIVECAAEEVGWQIACYSDCGPSGVDDMVDVMASQVAAAAGQPVRVLNIGPGGPPVHRVEAPPA